MSIGLGLLQFPPEHFWSMTIPELQAAMSGSFGDGAMAAPLARKELDELMRRFPDEGETINV